MFLTGKQGFLIYVSTCAHREVYRVKSSKNAHFILQAFQILACTTAYIIENNMQISTHRTGLHDILPKAYKCLVKEASCKKQKRNKINVARIRKVYL